MCERVRERSSLFPLHDGIRFPRVLRGRVVEFLAEDVCGEQKENRVENCVSI